MPLCWLAWRLILGVDSICLKMNKLPQRGTLGRRIAITAAKSGVALLLALCNTGCRTNPRVRIAFIPQTDGTINWEAAHVGAEIAASHTGSVIYWNAPTREDDVEAQIALVEHAVEGRYRGLVLAPDQALALISPVRSALAHGIPTVIIGSPLPIPAGDNLFYILNNDVEGGQSAAKRVGELLHGHGTVAILGINPDVTGTLIRARAFEQFLVDNDAGIHIVDRRMGSYNFPHEQQVAEDTLRAHPDLDVIVDLMSPSLDGTLSALHAAPAQRSIRVIGFDFFSSPPFQQNPNLDCVIQANTLSMGRRAIEMINARLNGQKTPYITNLDPKLITRANVNSDEVRGMLPEYWTLGRERWSSIQ
jgi:ribose transport system substrate-binding protein